MDGTSVKNHEKSFHLLEMCDFFLTFSDDFLKISIHPHHFGAFGQYPSSPKLKGAKNLFKKENIEKSPTCFFKFPCCIWRVEIVTGHKNQPRINWFAPTNSELVESTLPGTTKGPWRKGIAMAIF